MCIRDRHTEDACRHAGAFGENRQRQPGAVSYTHLDVYKRQGIDIPTQKHDETIRIHIATFDAVPLKNIDDNARYNLANCEFAQDLFNASQPHYRGSIYSLSLIHI